MVTIDKNRVSDAMDEDYQLALIAKKTDCCVSVSDYSDTNKNMEENTVGG
jgi:hypothetical protein